MDENKKWVTQTEAANLLNVSKERILQLVKSNKLENKVFKKVRDRKTVLRVMVSLDSIHERLLAHFKYEHSVQMNKTTQEQFEQLKKNRVLSMVGALIADWNRVSAEDILSRMEDIKDVLKQAKNI